MQCLARPLAVILLSLSAGLAALPAAAQTTPPPAAGTSAPMPASAGPADPALIEDLVAAGRILVDTDFLPMYDVLIAVTYRSRLELQGI